MLYRSLWIASCLSLCAASSTFSADLKPSIVGGSNQTWDFGSGNTGSYSVYRWTLVALDIPSIKLICRYGGKDHPTNCISGGGALVAPPGYKICIASLLFRSTNIPLPSTFNGTLQDGASQMAWYAEFGSGPQPLSARVSFVVVPAATADPSCMKDGPVFQCGVGANDRQGCVQIQPGGVVR